MWDDKSKGDFGIIGPIDASGSRSLVPLIEDFIPMSGWNFRWRIAAAHNNSLQVSRGKRLSQLA